MRTPDHIHLSAVLDHIQDARLALRAARELIEPTNNESPHSLSLWRLRSLSYLDGLDRQIAAIVLYMRSGR